MSKVRYDRWIAGGVALLLHLLVVGLLFWLSMDASEQKHTRDKEIWISVGVDPDFGDKIGGCCIYLCSSCLCCLRERTACASSTTST